MAVYFANKIPRQPGACTAVSWSEHAVTSARAPVCAVATRPARGSVHRGGRRRHRVAPGAIRRPGVYPCALAWHPRALLAVGWTVEGRAVVGTELRVAGEETSTHAGRSITCIAWSPPVTASSPATTRTNAGVDRRRQAPTETDGVQIANPPGAGLRTSSSRTTRPWTRRVPSPDGSSSTTPSTGASPTRATSASGGTKRVAGAASRKPAASSASRKIFDSPAPSAALYHDGVGNLVTLGTDSVLSIFAPPKGEGDERGRRRDWDKVDSRQQHEAAHGGRRRVDVD